MKTPAEPHRHGLHHGLTYHWQARFETRTVSRADRTTAALARSVTRARSIQTYLTARLLVDRDLASDFFRAYAYFRWIDDVVDVEARSQSERATFIKRQRELIDSLYRGELPRGLTREEEIAADLIGHDREESSGLHSFVRNMLAIIEFDAHRKGRPVSGPQLAWYSDALGKAVTDGLLHFVGNGHPYPQADNRESAALAAHITHLLRDMVEDTAEGFINIPQEYLEENSILPSDIGDPAFQAWVRSRVHLARRHFREGKAYLDRSGVLRCKIAGYWYCARFEGVLDLIERDGYVLRTTYPRRGKLAAWLKMAWLAAWVTWRHVTGRT